MAESFNMIHDELRKEGYAERETHSYFMASLWQGCAARNGYESSQQYDAATGTYTVRFGRTACYVA